MNHPLLKDPIDPMAGFSWWHGDGMVWFKIIIQWYSSKNLGMDIVIKAMLPMTFLVGGLEHGFYEFPFSWECHNPNWRTYIFQRGGAQPPNRFWLAPIRRNLGCLGSVWALPRVAWAIPKTPKGHSLFLGVLSSFSPVKYCYFLCVYANGQKTRKYQMIAQFHHYSMKIPVYHMIFHYIP